MRKIRGDKPIGVIVHIYIEVSQGNSLCRYLYLKQTKMSCFPFNLLSFAFYKVGEQEGGTGPGWQGRGWHQWEGGSDGERGRR
jgi:hypothetical protein